MEESQPEESLEARVRGAVARERGPVAWLRSLSRPARLAFVTALVAADAMFFHRFMLRADLEQASRLRLGLMLAACLLVGGAAAWQALRPLYLPRPPAWKALALVAAALLLPVVFALWPAGPASGPSGVAYGWACFSSGVTQGGALLLLVEVLDRGSRSALLAAAAGAMLGLVGLLIVCPIGAPLHLVSGHASVPLALVAAAAWRQAAVSRARR